MNAKPKRNDDIFSVIIRSYNNLTKSETKVDSLNSLKLEQPTVWQKRLMVASLTSQAAASSEMLCK